MPRPRPDCLCPMLAPVARRPLAEPCEARRAERWADGTLRVSPRTRARDPARQGRPGAGSRPSRHDRRGKRICNSGLVTQDPGPDPGTLLAGGSTGRDERAARRDAGLLRPSMPSWNLCRASPCASLSWWESWG